MRFIITRDDKDWVVYHLDAPTTLLMKAEIIAFHDAILSHGKIYADITASWGISFLDDIATESPQFLKALGVNCPFKKVRGLTPFHVEDDGFVCSTTHRSLHRISGGRLIRNKMHYTV